ncbi:multiheme c-type cytochrome [Ghiorsea bivora]|uniref:multiheme c-type cytochrome n=1 Tax=Ghiorsea bivora TaxID=1485545 RepID=UPI0012FDBC75|nr:multiheme c-type cytochrome [Ghiorsea bivora]
MLRYKVVQMVLLILLGVFVAAAGWQNKLLNFWDHPSAAAEQHHDWSALEKNMRPEACAQCHESQFNDWKKSLHAKAYSPGLVGQFASMGHEAGSDCLRCHAPLEQQLFDSETQMLTSLKTLRQFPQGVSSTADLDASEAQLPLRHSGVSCAVCHVREGQRFGPPRKGSQQEGFIAGVAHGGFIASQKFEQSAFCAECHQFPQTYAINGKPLENTVREWQQSRFSQEGQHCQSCHMPDRKHQFKGIHDQEFTRKALDISVFINKYDLPVLQITSKHIGHAFPTYVTPKVTIQAKVLDKMGKVLQTWQWDMVREVFFAEGWQERKDTRLMPSETRVFTVSKLNEQAVQVLFEVIVIPDQFYKGVYQSLLLDNPEEDAKALIQRALQQAEQNDYLLYAERITVL